MYGKVAHPRLRHPVHPAAAVGSLRGQGTLCGRVSGRSSSAPPSPSWFYCRAERAAARAPLRVSDFTLNLFGKFLAYAILALGIDLIWGYTGVLSLGHGVFFGLGAYAMGMHLMLEIGTQSVYKNVLPDFMVWNQVTELPLFWRPFYSGPFTLAGGCRGPGRRRLRLRVPHVPEPYPRRLLLDHHPGARAQRVAHVQPQLAESRGHQRPVGLQDRVRLHAERPRHPARALRGHRARPLRARISCAASSRGPRWARCSWRSGTARRASSFRGTRPRPSSSSSSWSRRRWPAWPAPSTCRRSGIITPAKIGVLPSIEMIIWVAVGGRGTLLGPIVGAFGVNWLQSILTTSYPDLWLLVLGGMFVARRPLLPRRRGRHGPEAPAPAVSPRASSPTSDLLRDGEAPRGEEAKPDGVSSIKAEIGDDRSTPLRGARSSISRT